MKSWVWVDRKLPAEEKGPIANSYGMPHPTYVHAETETLVLPLQRGYTSFKLRTSRLLWRRRSRWIWRGGGLPGGVPPGGVADQGVGIRRSSLHRRSSGPRMALTPGQPLRDPAAGSHGVADARLTGTRRARSLTPRSGTPSRPARWARRPRLLMVLPTLRAPH